MSGIYNPKYLVFRLKMTPYGLRISQGCVMGFLYDGKVYLDRVEVFDKISKCPVVLPIPESDEQVEFLRQCIRWLKTKEGLRISNEYDTKKWIHEYPRGE